MTANGMIVSSRRRLLAHLRRRDADFAASEMEDHLGVLDTCGGWPDTRRGRSWG
jgi:hypothetical protein